MNISVYNQLGEKVGTVRLSTEVFGVKPKVELIQSVVTAMLANLRKPWAHTKTRGEVRGGGRKPWRQKGTGRARAGSIRSPLWRGGGVIFGPRKERNYTQKINKKVRRKALLMTLSDKAMDKKIIVLDEIKLENKKTKEFSQILQKLPVKAKKYLFIYQPKKEKELTRAARNISNLKILSIENLNLLDILKYDYLLTTKETLKEIEKKFADKSTQNKK
ncbi:MAG: 50S ribosomal protein L4 [Patescibacteria group bacterium]